MRTGHRIQRSGNQISGIALSLILFSSAIGVAMTYQSAGFALSTRVLTTGMINYWERVDVTIDVSKVVGVNNLSLGFTLDFEWKRWQNSAVLRQLAQDANFKLVRICDWRHQSDASPDPCIYWNEETKTGKFNWTNVDLLVGAIFEIGAEPLITLGGYDMQTKYLPSGMATNPTTGLPYPESWAAYSKSWVEHFKAVRRPVRFYEIVNEAWLGYWYRNGVYNETRLSYFLDFFNASYEQMHDANSEILVSNDAAIFKKFTDFWLQHGGKLDYISFHKYDSEGIDEKDEMALLRVESEHFVTRGTFYGVNEVRRRWFNAYGITLPAINSESGFSSTHVEGTDTRIQKVVGAVWTALMLRSSVLNNLQYTVYYTFATSASHGQEKPTGGLGCGMVNLDTSKPWYPYYVQKILGNSLSLGDHLMETTSSSDYVRPLAWIHNGTLNILLISKVDQPLNIFLHGVTGQLNFSKIDGEVSYLMPSLQTGIVKSTAPLSANGYAVILVQIVH